MKILVRCDSSDIIGTGHVMRCLNYTTEDNEYTFVCRNFKHNITDKIQQPHKLILLNYTIEPIINDYKTWLGVNEQDELTDLQNILKDIYYDCVIIDHYGIDHFIESNIKNLCGSITVISDIYDYIHYCNTFINYNCNDYNKLKSINLLDTVDIKHGIQNVIVNKLFYKVKKAPITHIQKICVMMGGSDPLNYTMKVLHILEPLNIQDTYIIVGPSNSHIDEIREYAQCHNCILKHNLSYDELINVYLNIDLCIGSLSVTAYERYIMNVKQVCLKIVDNQDCQNISSEFNVCTLDNLYITVFNLCNMNI